MGATEPAFCQVVIWGVFGSECVRTQRSITGVNSASLAWIRHPWRAWSTYTYKETSHAECTGLMPAEFKCICTERWHLTCSSDLYKRILYWTSKSKVMRIYASIQMHVNTYTQIRTPHMLSFTQTLTHSHTHICIATWTPCGRWVFGSQWLVSLNEKWMRLKLDKLKLDKVRETAGSKIEFLGSKTPARERW